MIDPSNDDDLDGLLGSGHLTGPARDRIFEDVAAQVAREPRPRARRAVWGIAMIAAGAAALLVIAPRIPRLTGTADHLRPKGDEAPAAQIGVACIGGMLAACPQGATLMFGASGLSGTGVLSAYAEPLDHGRERIWYFSRDGESPRLTGGDGTEVAQRAVRIGPEHAPGRYRVHAFLTRAPAPKPALLAGSPAELIASRTVDLQITAAPTAAP